MSAVSKMGEGECPFPDDDVCRGISRLAAATSGRKKADRCAKARPGILFVLSLSSRPASRGVGGCRSSLESFREQQQLKLGPVLV